MTPADFQERRADAIQTATDSARRVLAVVDFAIRREPNPMKRRALRKQAYEIRRRLIGIMTMPNPFVAPVIVPPAMITAAANTVDCRTPGAAVTQPIERGAP